MFSGKAREQGIVELCSEYNVLAWGERNLGVACGNLEEMSRLQEAACFADVFIAGGDAELGLDHFVRSAALTPRENLRYDYRAYSAPEGKRSDGKETAETRVIRESWERQASRSKREKDRLAWYLV